MIIQRQGSAVPDFESFVNEGLRFGGRQRPVRAAGTCSTPFQYANDDLDVMLAKTIQPKWLRGPINLSVGTKFDITVPSRPFSNIGMKPFAIFHHRREQQQVASFL